MEAKMKKYTKQEVIESRLCGLKTIDKLIDRVGRAAIIDEAIDHHRSFPNLWRYNGDASAGYLYADQPPGLSWGTFDGMLHNAVAFLTKSNKVYTYNVDELLSEDEMARIAAVCGYVGSYIPQYPRK